MLSLPKKISGVSALVQSQDDFQYYFDLAGEICRRAEHKAHLSDDEIIILSVVASQLTLAKYVKPGDRDSDGVLNTILGLLDHDDVNKAMMSKMTTMLSDYAQSRTRLDAPSGKMVENLGVCEDSDEPAADPEPYNVRRSMKSINN